MNESIDEFHILLTILSETRPLAPCRCKVDAEKKKKRENARKGIEPAINQ
jgi:hypothetical protein